MRTSFGVTFGLIVVSFITADFSTAETLRGAMDVGSETRQLSVADGSGSIGSLSSNDGSKEGLEERTTNYHHGHQEQRCAHGQCWSVDVFDQ
ncbi:hypothetical protein ON010_g14892 [Phytophthora cinnamomi]|nr:hypothetical protein ON010_g14892 [Phytophthora cinnamomi]